MFKDHSLFTIRGRCVLDVCVLDQPHDKVQEETMKMFIRSENTWNKLLWKKITIRHNVSRNFNDKKCMIDSYLASYRIRSHILTKQNLKLFVQCVC